MTDEAILLSKQPLRETSWLLLWLTRGSGVIRAVHRRADPTKKPGAFRSYPDLFERHEILVAPSKTGDLHTIRECRLLDAHEGIRKSYTKLTLVSYFATLLAASVESEHPTPELFKLLCGACRHLAGAGLPSRKVLLHFEKRLATELGILAQEDPRAPIRLLRDAGIRIPNERDTVLESLE